MTDVSVLETDLPSDIDADILEQPLPLDTFAWFDPLTGPPPRAFTSQFENIALRARALLEGWSADHIMDAADYLAYLLSTTPGTAPEEGEMPGQQLPLEARESPIARAAATWAKYDSGERDTDDTHPLNQPFWPSIFACYALAHIGLAHRSCAYGQPVPSPATDNAVKERFIVASDPSLGAWPLTSAEDLSRETVAVIALHAFVSLEAVCCAESLVSSERKIATNQSVRAKKASAAKHVKTRALNRRVRALYAADPDFAPTSQPRLSNQRVADIIWDHQLTEKERGALKAKNPTHTLAKWIAEFRQE